MLRTAKSDSKALRCKPKGYPSTARVPAPPKAVSKQSAAAEWIKSHWKRANLHGAQQLLHPLILGIERLHHLIVPARDQLHLRLDLLDRAVALRELRQ